MLVDLVAFVQRVGQSVTQQSSAGSFWLNRRQSCCEERFYELGQRNGHCARFHVNGLPYCVDSEESALVGGCGLRGSACAIRIAKILTSKTPLGIMLLEKRLSDAQQQSESDRKSLLHRA